MKLQQTVEVEWTPSEHEVDDEEERAKAEQMERELAECEEEAERQRKARSQEICSCGHYTCPMRPLYGHPLPVFQEDIEPRWPQMKRDERALQLKAN